MTLASVEYIETVVGEVGTEDLARRIAGRLPPRITVALIGPLGSGKTRFVRALAESSGVPPRSVASPTFVLCRHYLGRVPIHHLDAYRVSDDDAWHELGVEEWTSSSGWTLIEWADRFAHFLVPPLLEIRIEILGADDRRRFTVRAHDRVSRGVVLGLAERLRSQPESSAHRPTGNASSDASPGSTS